MLGCTRDGNFAVKSARNQDSHLPQGAPSATVFRTGFRAPSQAMMTQQSPATATGGADGGDEVQRRFRYQVNYGALKALQLLAVEAHLAAIYCEHIEDLLLEQDDGKFIAIQIKTRELNQQPFKSTEQTVITALSRFCIRGARFPHWFA